jgi:hypothetical protein|tara:strand:+ start:2065 stop:2343 length:279 start_codon:yes stop_codon:yes gene_type:complete
MERGMDPGEINAMRKAQKEAEFYVWEENWDIVCMFIRMQTQWRVSMNGVIGLDYAVLQWLCKIYLVEDPANLLEGLQLMEARVLSSLNSKSD